MKIAALWFVSLVVVAAVSSALTLAVMRKAPSTAEGPHAVPWSMGAQSLKTGPDVTCGASGNPGFLRVYRRAANAWDGKLFVRSPSRELLEPLGGHHLLPPLFRDGASAAIGSLHIRRVHE